MFRDTPFWQSWDTRKSRFTEKNQWWRNWLFATFLQSIARTATCSHFNTSQKYCGIAKNYVIGFKDNISDDFGWCSFVTICLCQRRPVALVWVFWLATTGKPIHWSPSVAWKFIKKSSVPYEQTAVKATCGDSAKYLKLTRNWTLKLPN